MAKKYERKTKKKPETEQEKKDRRGAPKGQFQNVAHDPTETSRAVVKSLVSFGIPQELIAEELEISVDTLAKYYRRELNLSQAKAVARMGQGVYERGIKGSVQDAHFYLKTQGYKFGWSEKHQHEHTGKDGGPIQAENKLLPSTHEWLESFAGGPEKETSEVSGED